LPEIDVRMGSTDFGAPKPLDDTTKPPAVRPTEPAPKSGGCGCDTTGRNGAGGVALILAACVLSRRRRKV
jgi:uncharacterized protein (TIGR03382 family)